MIKLSIEEPDEEGPEMGLYFDGIFDVHKHEAVEDDPRIVN